MIKIDKKAKKESTSNEMGIYTDEDFEESLNETIHRIDNTEEIDVEQFLRNLWDESNIKPIAVGGIEIEECFECERESYLVHSSKAFEKDRGIEETIYERFDEDGTKLRMWKTVKDLFSKDKEVLVCDECHKQIFDVQAERLQKDIDGEKDLFEISKFLKNLWNERNINPKDVIISHITECPICEEEFYNLEAHEGIEDVDSCGICGWDECLIFDKWAYRRHMEYIEDRMVIFGDAPTNICHACEENFHYHPDGTIQLYSSLGEKFSSTYVGNYLQNIPEITGEGISYHDLSKEEQEMIQEVIEGTYYVSTDAWRGHHQTKTEGKYAVKVHSDNILSMSQDAENLKKFDDTFKEVMNKMNIPHIRLVTTSSNIFSHGYDLFVPAKKSEEVEEVIEKLKDYYRNPSEHFSTAYSGKSPASASNKISVDEAIKQVID